MKKCFRCKKTKNIDQFYTHKGMADGHLGKCKNCTKNDAEKRYSDPKNKVKITEYERVRFQNPERKKKVLDYQRERRARNKGKNRAKQDISNGIRNGKIKRLPCEVCGDTKSQAHHADYRKHYDVKWLCFKHHRELHGQKVNTQLIPL